VGVCFIDMPPYMIDFNIHPKKREVKIYRERKVMEIIQSCLKRSKPVFMLSQEKPSYGVKSELIGVIDNTIAVYRRGDFIYFFDLHLLSERLNYETGMDETKSCKVAFKAGQNIEREEIIKLIDKWTEFNNPEVCPHGRPIYYRMYLGDIYKKLGRSF